MAKVIQLEVSLRADSNFRPAEAKRLVQTHLETLTNPVRDFQGACIQQLGLREHVASVRFYNGVTSVRSILFEQGSERIVDEINAEEWSVTENIREIVPRIYKFNCIESESINESLSVFSEHWLCPNEKFENLWENLYLPTDVKTRLLDYVCSIYSLRNGFDDDALISLNKMVLIYGATGTGKTSLCKALAHKAAVRLGTEFNYGVFIHLDLQGCVGYSIESGVDLSKLKDTMDKLQALLEDKNSLAFVLIENIDTFTRRRNTGSSDAQESSKSMDFLINHLDKLRRFRNVVVLATSLAGSLVDNAVIDRVDLKCCVGCPSPPLIYKILAGGINEIIRSGYLQASNPLPKSATVKAEATLFEEVKTLQSIADASASKGLSGRLLKKLPVLTMVRCEVTTNFDKTLMGFLKVMKKCLKLEIMQNEVLSHSVIRPTTLTSPHSVSSSTNLEAHLPCGSWSPAKVKCANTPQSIQRTHYSQSSFDTISEAGSNPASVKCPAVRTEEADTNVQLNKTELDELYSENSQDNVDRKASSLESGISKPIPVEDDPLSVDKCSIETEFSFTKVPDQESMETSSISGFCELNPISSHESSEAMPSAESSSQMAIDGENSDSEQLLKQKHLIKECVIDLSTCVVPNELKKKLTDGPHPFVKATEFTKKYDKLRRPVGRRRRRTVSGTTSSSGSVRDAGATLETSSPARISSTNEIRSIKSSALTDVSASVDVQQNEGPEITLTTSQIDTGVASGVNEVKLFSDQSASCNYVLLQVPVQTFIAPSNVAPLHPIVPAEKVDRSKLLRAPPKTLKSVAADGCHRENNSPQIAAPTRPGPQVFKEQTRENTIKLKRKPSGKLNQDVVPEVINIADDEDVVPAPPPPPAKQLYAVVTVQEGGLVKDINGKPITKKVYHCQICDFSFLFKREFNKHQQDVHKTEDKMKSVKHKCGYCCRELITFDGFRKHEEACRKKAEAKGLATDKNPNPTSGSESFPNGESPNGNVSPDRKRGRFSCQQCDKVLHSKEEFGRHMTFHQEERPFKCSRCDKTYKTEMSLKFHHERVHSPKKIQLHQLDKTNPPIEDPAEDNLQPLGGVTQDTSTIIISDPAYCPQFTQPVTEQLGVASTDVLASFGDFQNYQNQPCTIPNSSDEKDFLGDGNFPQCPVCEAIFVGQQELEQHYPVHSLNASASNDNDLENEFFREQRLGNEVVPEAVHCVDIETTDDYLSVFSLTEIAGGY